MRRILDMSWCGQVKIQGHRAQLHVPKSTDIPVLAYTRKGELHKKELPPEVESEVRRLFKPNEGYNVIDCEWVKKTQKIFVFDILKADGEILFHETYQERYGRLPRVYLSKHVETLSIFRTVEKCLKALNNPDPEIEGLVFRSLITKGFSGTSIIRCPKKAND